MNSKVEHKYSELIEIFDQKTGWHKARVKFFVSFICAMCKLQTVSFVKLSQGFEGAASYESNLRRIQRFFAGYRVDFDLIAKIIFGLLPVEPPYGLSMDRTNWKFGQLDINILMISVNYKGVGIPLIWSLLPKRGNSNCSERKELMRRYIKLFGTSSIDSFMADREFIGQTWFKELIDQNIDFHIRIKENMWINVPGKPKKKAFWIFNDLKYNQVYQYPKIVRIGTELVYLTGLKTFNRKAWKNEFLIIASYRQDPDVLGHYRDRWQIETMFKAMKSSGFNMEDTHLTNLDRISKLVALTAIAFVWAYRVGINKHENIKPIKIKKHGRRAYSFFKYGLIQIAYSILNTTDNLKFTECVKLLSCT